MKKILTILFVVILCCTAALAQNETAAKEAVAQEAVVKKEKVSATDVKKAPLPKATITDTIAAPTDMEILMGLAADNVKDQKKLERKVDALSGQVSNLNQYSSMSRHATPIIILIIIGGVVILLVYLLTLSKYRSDKLKYEALVNCSERLGAVPDYFSRTEKLSSIPHGGRVHLVLSILCGLISLIFIIVALGTGYNRMGFGGMLTLGVGAVVGFIAIRLFMQFNKISERNIEKQQ